MTEQNGLSVATCDYGEINVENVSVVQGGSLDVRISWAVSELHVVVLSVGEHEEHWVIKGPLAWESRQPGLGRLAAAGEQPPGLYLLAAVYDPSRDHMGEDERLTPPILFEVRAASNMPRTPGQLADAREAIVRARTERHQNGIGKGPVQASVVVFVKDLLMTTRINLGAWEIVPISPVGWLAELQVVDRELRALGVLFRHGSDAVREASFAEPAALVKFPIVRGESLEQCGSRALAEVNLLLPLLAAHRGSLGQTFFVFVAGQNETRYVLTAPHYRGNLMGGFISGEAPEQIRRHMAALQQRPHLRLFTMLLGEAIREQESAFRYVRLWSLLETMAQARGHTAAHIPLSWGGPPKVDAQGKAVTVGGAKAKVLGLLRALLVGQGVPARSYEINSARYGPPADQLGIWYRRRNCVAHGDPNCICRDPLKKASKDEYKICLDARRDDHQGHDRYLWSLEQITKDAVFRMLR